MIDLSDAYYKPKPHLEEGWDKVWTQGYVDGFPELREEYRGSLYLCELTQFRATVPGFVYDPLLIGAELPPDLSEQFLTSGLSRLRFDGVVRGILSADIWQPDPSETEHEWDLDDEEADAPVKLPILVQVVGVMEYVPASRPCSGEDDPIYIYEVDARDKTFVLEALHLWLGNRVELWKSECKMEMSFDGIPIRFLRHVLVDPPGPKNLWRDYIHANRDEEESNCFLYTDFSEERNLPSYEKEEPLYEYDDDGEPRIH